MFKPMQLWTGFMLYYILSCNWNARVVKFFFVFQKSGNAVLGLPYALASLSFCQSFNLDLLRASTTLTLAELWLSLGANHAKRALTLLHGAFPMILGHGGLELRARAYIAEAKCYLSDPSFSGWIFHFFFSLNLFFLEFEFLNTFGQVLFMFDYLWI